jgi:type VI secretion system protein ImpH
MSDPTSIPDDDQTPSLVDEPYRFDFFQAVRLLHERSGGRAAVGHDHPPATEAVHFEARTGVAFPASAVHDLRPGPTSDAPPHLTVAFLGLTGPSGVLPAYFTETVVEEGPGGPLGDFLNIFDHRLISLFYRAWERSHPHLATTPETRDRFESDLAALAGLPRNSQPFELLPYAGLLADRRRSASGLQTLLADLLNGDDSPLPGSHGPVPVDVIPFLGRWLPLDPATRPVLSRSAPAPVGPSTVIGRRVRDHRGKFRVRIGPLARPAFDALMPESTQGEAYSRVVRAIRSYAGPAFEFDLQLVLQPDAATASRLGRSEPVRLARTWLRSPCPAPREPLAIVLQPRQ